MAPAEAPQVDVEVAYSAVVGHMDLVPLTLAAGATVAAALAASGLLERHGLQLAQLRAGVWGKARELGTVLRARDRVEIYRPLLVDPKEARRQRYRKDRPPRRAAPA